MNRSQLEGERAPVLNLNLIATNPVFCHPPIPIEEFCGADEHFLRVAAAQSAGASEGSRINDGNFLSSLAAPHGCRRGRRPGSDHDNIVFGRHDSHRGILTAKEWTHRRSRLLPAARIRLG